MIAGNRRAGNRRVLELADALSGLAREARILGYKWVTVPDADERLARIIRAAEEALR